MPLVFNSSGRKLYVLRRISTSEVLNRFVVYPNAVDDAPIEGLDQDLEYLAIDRDLEPAFDPRVYNLVTSEAKVGSLWRITYTTPKKAADQIKISVTNREQTEIARHVKEYEREKLEILGLQVLFAINAGATLTLRQQAIRNKINAAAAKLLQNDQRAAELFTQIDANQVPDIDSGWAGE